MNARLAVIMLGYIVVGSVIGWGVGKGLNALEAKIRSK